MSIIHFIYIRANQHSPNTSAVHAHRHRRRRRRRRSRVQRLTQFHEMYFIRCGFCSTRRRLLFIIFVRVVPHVHLLAIHTLGGLLASSRDPLILHLSSFASAPSKARTRTLQHHQLILPSTWCSVLF